MPKIIFFCPPAGTINGGIKYIFRMADVLRAAGQDAVVFEKQGERPGWFSSAAPVVSGIQLAPDADEIFVLPEDQAQMLESIKDWPQKKIIYNQNHFYGAYRLPAHKSYADYGVRHVLCSGRTIMEHIRLRHPAVTPHLVPCAVDPEIFRPAPEKHDVIAFFPRKRAVEAAYICDMFEFSYPQLRNWEWKPVVNLSEADAAKALGEAEVFLSLGRLEGFGLTPLEAMSAGCVAAGFTGIGGREYANGENGFWVAEDDFPACLKALEAAIKLARGEASARAAHADACRKTLAAYTPALFEQAVNTAWARILGA